MRQKLAAGNWKMNGTSATLPELKALADTYGTAGVDVLICPPAALLHRAAEVIDGSAVAVGGQDCHADGAGAHTGDTSAEMLKDAGASSVIVGHSERRTDHNESDAAVCAKAETAMATGLTAIVCLGESLQQRDAGETLEVIGSQLAGSVPEQSTGDSLVIAYEPIWAIGTGKVPTLEQIGEVHGFLRAQLVARFGNEVGAAVRLLYGGSVKPSNATEIFAVEDVDGALVGGASLKATDFAPIIAALENS
ncbi:triose-phosphate isomerase [Parasedimentitalea marina]|uniref:Triosephosphate isomerase n=1 Tax=Parasedimentitalea marina TaxID=2483033 RepID=A0A3T0N0X9_9RHOB|nr:triose-phosphate isomerase [Parasedimentitalea marina]AZV77667.1 triose-phosphate isomerase [Parasedimentitalea marina]